MDSTSTEDLVEMAKSGCRQSFGALVEKYRPRLKVLIELRLWFPLRNRVEPEDVFQETCLKAFQALGKYKSTVDGSFFKWLGGITEHVILNLARRHVGNPERSVEISLENAGRAPDGSSWTNPIWVGAGPSPSDPMKDRERFELFRSALSKLDEDRREVVILGVVYMLRTREIAERLGRTRDAVSMLLLRAVRDLRDLLGDCECPQLPPSRIECLRQEFGVRTQAGDNSDGQTGLPKGG